MAPAFLSFSSSPLPPVARRKEAIEPSELEMLRSKNEELQRVVEKSQKWQAELVAELEKTRMRLLKTEEAEERLCAQLGELEAESVVQARAYNLHINSLKQQLAQAQKGLLPPAREEVKRRN